ncbi:hypothetical protein AAFF_G00003900 [Aldrovandia affinis]|uniref:TSC22 domain family protein 2 n=1 Tax=Aldrovandia affinis TaxID=143900 RepID=A0AAD7TDG3_9TELE|nr:hypothetical protein AAFF_G00003900 [Aldrovandia affinis]
MPAKKKSCFQITSVTQAQVAASSITDDTESLDDPDESRTEDVSSEIFDVSRADFEPEVCDRSSSEETLNNVGESEPHGAVPLHIPHDGQLPAMTGPLNGGFAFRSTAVSGVALVGPPHVLGAGAPAGQPPTAVVGLVQQQPAPVSAVTGAQNVTTGTSQQQQQPPPPVAATTTAASSTTTTTTATTASCSSRFRVIKLDHGTGEPFRRGRWTCTEFYERDSEGSVISRTVDSIKPASTLEQASERDSGLGATGGSVAVAPPTTLSAPGLDATADAASSLAPTHLHPADHPQHTYSVMHQPSSGAFQPLGYAGKQIAGLGPSPVPTQPQVQVSVQPAAPQNLLPPGHNGMPQVIPVAVQKSPSMPPATQGQQFATYPAHHLPSAVPTSQADYRHQHTLLSAAAAGQALSVASLPVGGPPASQGPSPVMTPATAGGGAQVLGLLAQSGESAVSLPGNQPPLPAQGLLMQQPGGAGGAVGVASLPQLPSGAALAPSHAALVVAAPPGVQNVPTAVPGASSTPLTMPNLAPVGVGQLLRSGGVAAGLGFGQPLPLALQVDESRRKSDALPQPSAVSGKDATKPLIPEGLQLPAPSVNSLFGIPINLDGDEDR